MNTENIMAALEIMGKGMAGIHNDDLIAAFDDISGSQPV